jgi:hypothetical protein
VGGRHPPPLCRTTAGPYFFFFLAAFFFAMEFSPPFVCDRGLGSDSYFRFARFAVFLAVRFLAAPFLTAFFFIPFFTAFFFTVRLTSPRAPVLRRVTGPRECRPR